MAPTSCKGISKSSANFLGYLTGGEVATSQASSRNMLGCDGAKMGPDGHELTLMLALDLELPELLARLKVWVAQFDPAPTVLSTRSSDHPAPQMPQSARSQSAE